MSESSTVGKRLRTVRLGLGLDQQVVAEQLGIDPTQISRHERDRRKVSEETALRYAKYYGVKVDFLLQGPSPQPFPPNTYIESGDHGKIPESGIPKSRGQRLQDLRKGRGYVKLAPTARMIGVNPITMTHHEKGLREITRQAAEVYARFFNVTAGWILWGEDLPAGNFAPIVGVINGDGRVNDMPESVTPGVEDRVPIAALADGTDPQEVVAFLIGDNSLYPRYAEGDVVLSNKVSGEISPLDINDCECIVTTPSGETSLRFVKPEGEGRFTIYHHNIPPEFGVRLVSAWPVVQVNRHRARTPPPG